MTRIDEIADGIYRIFTPVAIPGPGEFSFNQYLIVDDEPLLFHTGMRRLFQEVSAAVARVIPVERLRWLALFAFRGRRVRRPQPVSRGRTAGRAPMRPDRGDGLDRRLSPTGRRRRSATGRRWRSAATASNGSTRRTCRMPGNAA